MSTWAFNYSFNIDGNASAATEQITGGVTAMTDKLKDATGVWNTFEGKIVAFNNLTQFVEGFSRTVGDTLAPGAALNASLKDLQAISGEAGEGLKMIEKYARDASKTFGGPAAQSVEAYKLLLGQLSPELTKTPQALKAMGDNVSILSKTMEGNITSAAEVLTTAMNQYGVSLADPMEASRKMAQMMNVMAAAGREGSAELPTIKVALEQCGMAAKAAGVSFEETNAAIQVLDKAGKKGSEGGVALRNVMTTLERGRFLPKDVQKELSAAGLNINHLTDKSRALGERLRMLQPLLNDSALFTKLFGRENASAAMALIQNVGELDELTEAITGTNTAFEQAEIVMESYNEKKARVQATFDDFRISVFNTTGDFGIWIEVVTGALEPISQLIPLVMGVGQAVKFVAALNFSGLLSGISRAATVARYQLLFMIAELRTGQMASIGFLGNITRATAGVLRFATVGLLQGIKALGAFVLSLITGGAASATFSGIAVGSFTAFKTSAVAACRAVSIAIMSIPVIGWIIAVITAIGALFVYFWNTSAKFRAVVKGLGSAFVAEFRGIWDVAKTVFTAIGELIVACLKMDGKGIKEALGKMANGFKEHGANVGKAFMEGYNAEMERSKAMEAGKDDAGQAIENIGSTDTKEPPTGGLLNHIGGNADKADKIKNITVNIEKLVERFEIRTTNLTEDVSRVKDLVGEALMGAVNDINYAR